MGYDEIGVLFMDLDKQAYAHAAEAMAPRIMPGGLLIADNVLWYGRVAEPDPPEDPDNTLAVRQFNEMMYARAEFHCTILPLRDGVMVARKKG
jgi:caffeoyl-CoA O-methyltransferase